MKVEAGKKHITRGGQVVGPMVGPTRMGIEIEGRILRAADTYTDGTHVWLEDGRLEPGVDGPMDLIAVVGTPQPAADPLDAAIARAEEDLAVLRRARELKRRIMGEGE